MVPLTRSILSIPRTLAPGAAARKFLRCVKTREQPNTDIEVGHRSTSACQLGNIAFRVGRRIRWDARKEEIIGDREANAYLTREYRKPYDLPVI